MLAEVLKHRPHRTGAEIGVKEGKTTAVLLERLPGLELLYCVDPWEHYADYDSDRAGRHIEWPSQRLLDRAYNEFLRRTRPHQGRVVVLRTYSRYAAPTIPNQSLDFAFIDANHAYEYVKEDILLWWPKVRVGGLISGHDYDRWSHAWGVKRAVDEAFGDAVHLGPAWCWWVYKEG